MSSPAKRRKLNKSDAAQPKSRGLDFFFGKQQTKSTIEEDDVPASTLESTKLIEKGETPLTDEQLARRLQEEWDREDAAEVPGLTQEPPSSAEPLSRDAILDDLAETSKDVDLDVKVDAPTDQHDGQGEPLQAEDEGAKLNGNSKHTLSLQSATAAEDTITTTIPFDQSPVTFEPAQYTTALQKQWASEGGSATYALLTRCFVLVNATQSRIKIVDALVNLLRVIIEGDPESLLPAVSGLLPFGMR